MNKEYIKQLVNKHKPTIFEIGCADGTDTEDFINTFKELNIYCFEPEPKNIAAVKQKIKHENHYLYEGVVYDTNGTVTFHRSGSSNDPSAASYSGSVKAPKDHLQQWPTVVFNDDITVPAITLDTFCEQNNIELIDFIWADVQGCEDNLIKGATNALKKTRFLYTEYSNRELYSGQCNLAQILSLLGSDWSILHQDPDYGSGADVLLKNNTL
jgi:2-O-methyltransferase